MSAYVLVRSSRSDRLRTLSKIAYPVIAEFGGKYLVRGGVTEVREGDWKPNRLVIVEFEHRARKGVVRVD